MLARRADGATAALTPLADAAARAGDRLGLCRGPRLVVMTVGARPGRIAEHAEPGSTERRWPAAFLVTAICAAALRPALRSRLFGVRRLQVADGRGLIVTAVVVFSGGCGLHLQLLLRADHRLRRAPVRAGSAAYVAAAARLVCAYGLALLGRGARTAAESIGWTRRGAPADRALGCRPPPAPCCWWAPGERSGRKLRLDRGALRTEPGPAIFGDLRMLHERTVESLTSGLLTTDLRRADHVLQPGGRADHRTFLIGSRSSSEPSSFDALAARVATSSARSIDELGRAPNGANAMARCRFADPRRGGACISRRGGLGAQSDADSWPPERARRDLSGRHGSRSDGSEDLSRVGAPRGGRPAWPRTWPTRCATRWLRSRARSRSCASPAPTRTESDRLMDIVLREDPSVSTG